MLAMPSYAARCCSLLALADTHGAKSLRAEALAVVGANFATVKILPEWDDLLRTGMNPALIQDRAFHRLPGPILVDPIFVNPILGHVDVWEPSNEIRVPISFKFPHELHQMVGYELGNDLGLSEFQILPLVL
jgi:hypothetical protein